MAGLLDDVQEYARRSGRNLGGLLDWLGGGAQAGAEPTMALLRGDALDQPLLPTADSGGRIGAVASAVGSTLMPVAAPTGALGAGPVLRAADAALDMAPEARAARAAGMGFPETEYYHYTASPTDFTEFRPSELRGASFFATRPEGAIEGARAGGNETGRGAGGADRMMPVRVAGPIYGRDVHAGPIDLPQTIGPQEYERIVADARNFTDPSMTPNQMKAARDVLTKTVNGAYDEAVNPAAAKLLEEAERRANQQWKATGRYPEDVLDTLTTDERAVLDDAYTYTRKQTLGHEQTMPWQVFERGISHGDLDAPYQAALKRLGFRGAVIGDEAGTTMAVMDPTAIRSRFAAFDPARSGEADLLASRVPTSGLLAQPPQPLTLDDLKDRL